MSDVALRVKNLGKMYRIGVQDAPPRTFGQATRNLIVSPFAYLSRMRRPPTEEETLWALRDVSFEVKHGEVLGIIGRNGAGKSTLLKILSRITEPSSGHAQVFGRIGSLLEVGTGFHPELTGRENIYLNGTILGMKRREIDRKFDEIVDFSGVEKFLDTPVKRYSSGMYVRLAFAVAAHLEPDILLVDEVLAVGDAAFQKKCLGKMGNVANEGKTVLFVSHDMRAITDLCLRTIWINCGTINQDGQSEVIVSEYLSSGTALATGWWQRPANIPSTSELELLAAEVSQDSHSPIPVVSSNQPFTVKIKYEVKSKLSNCSVILRITDMSGTVVFTSWDTDSNATLLQLRWPGMYQSVCRVSSHLLKPGRYSVTVAAHVYGVKVLDCQEAAFNFGLSDVGYKFNEERLGVVQPILDWVVDRV
ncbi:MAG: ABC transporter ATP-binding protein [Caldilineaceae bacterium]|nr:ABC transporter ATP-binding protein [Caldilineaceae bacterium]